MRRALLILSLCLVTLQGWSQLSQVKKAFKQIEKGEFEKAESLLQKAIAKDSLYPATYYAGAHLYFNNNYPQVNLDSAYLLVLRSISLIHALNTDDYAKLQKQELDSTVMISFKSRLDSAGYARAIASHTVYSYQHFIDGFSTAPQIQNAMTFRNQLAYAEARRRNTYDSYKEFISTYPNATQVPEATKRYEKLYYEQSVAHGNINSYMNFLKKNPETPYRDEAEQYIYHHFTTDNEPESYRKFIHLYPESKYALAARNRLYHVLVSAGLKEQFPSQWLTDSLRNIKELSKNKLTLIAENDRFGFMDSKGNTVIPPNYTEPFRNDLCHYRTTDFFIAHQGVIALDGTIIYPKRPDSAEDLGFGLLLLHFKETGMVIDKWGNTILTDLQKATILGNKLLAYHNTQGWWLASVHGQPLIDEAHEEISILGEWVIFEKNGRYAFQKIPSLLQAVNARPLRFKYPILDYEILRDSVLWVASPNGEGLFDMHGQQLLPIKSHKITAVTSGYLVAQAGTITLYSEEFKRLYSTPYDKMLLSKAWLSTSHNNLWTIHHIKQAFTRSGYDSIRHIGDHFLVAYHGDRVEVYFASTEKKEYKDVPFTKLLTASGSVPYLLVKNSTNDPSIYTTMGEKIYKGSFEAAWPIDSTYLVLEIGGKYGLITSKGEPLLPPAYDAIVQQPTGLSILKAGKLGLFNPVRDVFITPAFNKKIRLYNDHLFIASHIEKLGLVNNTGQIMSEFIFDDITYWNDSMALVKHQNTWYLHQIYNPTKPDTIFTSLQLIGKVSGGLQAIVRAGGKYGVISSIDETLIPTSFSDIINIGSSEDPLYFAEKHIAEAGFYIVLYYDKKGQLIRKQVFEEEEYSLIYCED